MSKSTRNVTPVAAGKYPTALAKPEVSGLLHSLETELWKARIAPDVEHEKYPGWVFLYFQTVDELDTFLRIVTRVETGDASLYRRILCSDQPLETSWRYEIFPVNPWQHEHVHLEYRASVFLPVSDVPEVLKRVLDHNRVWEDKRPETGRRTARCSGTSPAVTRAGGGRCPRPQALVAIA